MNAEYEYGKWYKADEPPKPQFRGSIYFVTKSGKKYAGTFNDYSQFLSLDEEIFEAHMVEKWTIRERKISKPKQSNFTHKGIKVNVQTRQDIGFHWRASFHIDGKERHVNREEKDEAIDAAKNLIEDVMS